MAKQYRSCRNLAMALPAALMFYGIAALLAACVISGVGVLAGWFAGLCERTRKSGRIFEKIAKRCRTFCTFFIRTEEI